LGSGLENRRRRKASEGSNPSPSAGHFRVFAGEGTGGEGHLMASGPQSHLMQSRQEAKKKTSLRLGGNHLLSLFFFCLGLEPFDLAALQRIDPRHNLHALGGHEFFDGATSLLQLASSVQYVGLDAGCQSVLLALR
jgi:hypothetical protein